MTKSNHETKEKFAINMTAAERAALNEMKGNRTLTQLIFDIKNGIHEPLRLPESAYEHNKWIVLTIFPTKEQADLLVADAAHRGLTVPHAVREDVAGRKPKSNHENNERFKIHMTAAEHDALKEIKGHRTFAELILDIKNGVQEPLRLPESAYKHNEWHRVTIYTTKEQADFLVADAARRGLTVPHAVREDVAGRKPKSNHENKERFQIGVTAAERAALNEMKGTRTLTELILDIKNGVQEPLRLPESAYENNEWIVLNIYPTKEQADVLVADAARRGLSVPKAVCEDVTGRKPKSNRVTDNLFRIAMTAAERDALKEIKGNRTFTELIFDIREGNQEPVRLPASAYEYSGLVNVKIYPTKEQADVLVTDAAQRGLSVSRAVREDISVRPPEVIAKLRVLAKPKVLDVRDWETEPVRAALASVRSSGPFAYTESWSENRAFYEVAGVLIVAEALSNI